MTEQMIMRLGGVNVAQYVSTPKLLTATGPCVPAIRVAGATTADVGGVTPLIAVREIVGDEA